jgi:hypothetical protein
MLVYFWVAHYADGNCLPQFNPNTGEEQAFRDIEQNKLVRFGYYPFSEDFANFLKEKGHDVESRSLPIVEVNIYPPRRLIAYRTRTLSMSLQGSGETKETIKYVIGYQETIEGRNRKVLVQVDENGNVEIL